MKSISPNIFVNDLQATITFYAKLGFTLTDEVTTAEGEKGICPDDQRTCLLHVSELCQP
ncbi:VOC family protein [Spirosoma sp.]|uniref:VOC family protein n=1 Tax=Spirosoma sp. TaxID=1899569 RepID=UPI003B3B9D91